MRILYVDIDALRADHLGCYGYHRDTSPTIDRLAADGVRLEHCFTSDAPCMPSRTALAQGRFGIHSGVVNHGGTAAEPFRTGPERSFRDRPGYESWFTCLQEAGYHTASISPFPDRHGAWWFLSGLHEWINPGQKGKEDAHEINDVARPWLEEHAAEDHWLLHVNYWDPHTPYTTPEDYGHPFADTPPPDWYSEEIRRHHWDDYGTFSAQDPMSVWFPGDVSLQRPGLPEQFASTGDWKDWIDGYDTTIRYMDDHLQKLLDVLEAQGVLDETLVIVTADHGESQGELNVYGDHQAADLTTCRVPLVLRHPELASGGRVDERFHYQFDLAPTVLDLAGTETPDGWDAESFAPALGDASAAAGRDHLVISQMVWSCQRSVRLGRWLFIRTYHDGIKNFPRHMLFDVEADPHQLDNKAEEHPEVVQEALALLGDWHDRMMGTQEASPPVDPLQTVLREGGPHHPRPHKVEAYLERLRETGRAHHADTLKEQYPGKASAGRTAAGAAQRTFIDHRQE